MVNKFSNNAMADALTAHLNASFDYTYLYNQKNIINGKKESSAALMTSDKLSKIQFGIWGILPHQYRDDWKQFQSELSTLETTIDQLKTSEWLFEAFQKRRCLIIGTGYITTRIVDNSLLSFYHHLKNNELFCFAGIFNVLDDGFITFSILSRHLNSTDILNTTMPIILNFNKYSSYLTDNFPLKKLIERDYEMDASLLLVYKISKKHFKTNSDGLKRN